MRTQRPGIPKRIRPAPYVVKDLHKVLASMEPLRPFPEKQPNRLWAAFTHRVRSWGAWLMNVGR